MLPYVHPSSGTTPFSKKISLKNYLYLVFITSPCKNCLYSPSLLTEQFHFCPAVLPKQPNSRSYGHIVKFRS